MDQDIAPALREIAELLRQRVQQEEEARQTQRAIRERAEAQLAGLRSEDRQAETRQQMGEFRKQAEENREREQEFRSRLLLEFERHNAAMEQQTVLLEKLLSRLDRRP